MVSSFKQQQIHSEEAISRQWGAVVGEGLLMAFFPLILEIASRLTKM
jgi:hypothetical protein